MNVLLFVCLLSGAVFGAEWTIDHPRPGVLVLRDETGAWGGFSLGVAHINKPSYQVRKILDLTALPAGAVERAKAARLRLYLAIQDYSWNMSDRKHNGLNEAFEIVVNGHARRYATKDPRFPSRAGPQQRLRADWVDLEVPLDWLRSRRLTVLVRKLPGGRNDDYVYPGIDNSVERGHSATSFDGGKTWHTDKLNTIDARGEFMIRLVLCERPLAASLTWQPPDRLQDPAHWVAYHSTENGVLRLEPDPEAYDTARPVTATVQFRGTAPEVRFLDPEEKPLPTKTHETVRGTVSTGLPAGRWELGAVEVPFPASGRVRKVTVHFQRPARAPRPVVDLRPAMAPPRGTVHVRDPGCRLARTKAVLDNGALRAVFRLRPTLALESLYAAEVDRNILEHPERTHLFRLKVGDRVYGCFDSPTVEVKPVPAGFVAVAQVADTGLRVSFTARMETRELRLGCRVTNAGKKPIRFHLAFPHLAGLQLSGNSADDYYLFPWGGGIIAPVDATLRTAYGEESAWWQMIDLFSPTRGGGVYVRVDDPTGLYKSPCLRKGETVSSEYSVDEAGRGYLLPEMMWRTALEPAPGLAVTFDYLRRDRQPGRAFTAPDACLGGHPGDWRNAMTRYVAWAHRTWPPRPYPSKLTPCWHVVAPGWAQSPLFKDGAYRTDYLIPRYDVAEMMSWWTWSDRGPWGVPMNRLKQELGPALYERYKGYWVREPVTGKLMYPLNRGDYDSGYMPQWGGLPALRKHIQHVRRAGLVPMFYTDPILADANTRLAQKYGLKYGIVNPLWKDPYHTGKTPPGYVGSYASFNMCLDTEWYSNWVAQTLARVCRETGIDGVRVDEYGHRGYVCLSTKHRHLFAEPGHNAWLQALARNCRQIHAALDRVRPGLLLTAEFPGHDCMAAALEGAIVYDLRRHNPVRPTPLNLFRFYFPQCKVFEIDRPHRRHAQHLMLWNGEGAFNAFYSEAVHVLLKQNTDVFERLGNEPLVPTLMPRVYANRFGGGEKVIHTLFNATGHTIAGPVLPVKPDSHRHFIDLLTGRELTPVKTKSGYALQLKLKREETAVVAQLPR